MVGYVLAFLAGFVVAAVASLKGCFDGIFYWLENICFHKWEEIEVYPGPHLPRMRYHECQKCGERRLF